MTITAKQISHDMTLLLRQYFPVYYKNADITEGFDRPCMTMEVATIRTGAANDYFRHDFIPITIYFFAEERTNGYADLLTVQETLRRLLESPLPLAGTYLYPPEPVEFSIVKEDGSLIASVEYEVYQQRPDSIDGNTPMHPDEPLNNEYMEELTINTELE